MPHELPISLVLAAGFTLGCLGIHRARRHPDAIALTLISLLGLTATLYVGRHAHVSGHRTAEHAGPDHNWTAELRRPTP
ncbi:hypothetical protein [Methylobacterium gregans]|uniref:hypothetical protein n=1 Tax=Methylobacterium gregans TaxID=374424 RepID=UPI001EE20A36|nr:hypothetical protein [Methylobacterium gregans]MDQ0520027.1 hypothetical protein [Methylobacterium gregans]